MPQVSRDLLVDLWYPGEVKPEPAQPASADGLLYMFLHRDAAGNTRGAVRHPAKKHGDGQSTNQTTESQLILETVKTTAEYWSVGEIDSVHVDGAMQTSWGSSIKTFNT